MLERRVEEHFVGAFSTDNNGGHFEYLLLIIISDYSDYLMKNVYELIH
jgi:hypothetical protein